MSGAVRTRALAAVIGAAGAVFALTACGSSSPAPTSAAPAIKSESSALLTAAFRKYPRAPASQQTAPAISPHTGKTSSTFTLRLTARRDLGAHGYARYDYRVYLVGPRPRCAQFTQLTAAARGTRATVELRPPIELGWCRGTLHGTVLLEKNPSCPPAPASGRTRPCPSFSTKLEDVGHFKFVTT